MRDAIGMKRPERVLSEFSSASMSRWRRYLSDFMVP